MMFAGSLRLAGRCARPLVLTALAVGAMGVGAAPALAATPPKWGITMEHHNAYGSQAGLCPSGHAEPRTEDQMKGGKEPCGVDPLTEHEAGDKGETFARESGWNQYTIKVTNIGGTTSSATEQ